MRTWQSSRKATLQFALSLWLQYPKQNWREQIGACMIGNLVWTWHDWIWSEHEWMHLHSFRFICWHSTWKIVRSWEGVRMIETDWNCLIVLCVRVSRGVCWPLARWYRILHLFFTFLIFFTFGMIFHILHSSLLEWYTSLIYFTLHFWNDILHLYTSLFTFGMIYFTYILHFSLTPGYTSLIFFTFGIFFTLNITQSLT